MRVQALLLRWHPSQTKRETSLPGLVAFQRTFGQGIFGQKDGDFPKIDELLSIIGRTTIIY
jgi:hypothetical protein